MRRTRLHFVLAFSLFALGLSSTVSATVINVTLNSFDDRADETPLGDGVIDADLAMPGNQVTLRATIQEYNAHFAPGTPLPVINVEVPPGVYQLTVNGANEDSAATGDLDTAVHVHLIGTDAASTVIEVASTFDDRLFHVHQGRLHINNVHLKGTDPTDILEQPYGDNGELVFVSQEGRFEPTDCIHGPAWVTGKGGCVYNEGQFHARNTVFENAEAAEGGAVFNYGDTRIDDCVLRYCAGSALVNRGSDSTGNGIPDAGAAAKVVTSHFKGNLSSSFGGAINNGTGGFCSAESCTFEQNVAEIGGAAFSGFAQAGAANTTFVITRCALYENFALQGGGFCNFSSDMSVDNSTISCNTAMFAGGGGFSSLNQSDPPLPMQTLLDSCTVMFNQQMSPSVIGGLAGGLAEVLGGDPELEIPMDVKNSIVALNSAEVGVPPDYEPTIDFDPFCWLSADPLVGLLQDNGGNTLTHALQPNSPCVDYGFTSYLFDQRWVPRDPLKIDTGAFEGSLPGQLATVANPGCQAPLMPPDAGPQPPQGGGGGPPPPPPGP